VGASTCESDNMSIEQGEGMLRLEAWCPLLTALALSRGRCTLADTFTPPAGSNYDRAWLLHQISEHLPHNIADRATSAAAG